MSSVRESLSDTTVPSEDGRIWIEDAQDTYRKKRSKIRMILNRINGLLHSFKYRTQTQTDLPKGK